MRRLSLLLLLAPAIALAQSAPPDVVLPDFAPPAPAESETGAKVEPELGLDREIDIANIVTSAAKGVTTVQEAPAIVTIVTADEIRARGFKRFLEVLGTVPGWVSPVEAEGGQVALPLVRGTGQAALYMRDGVSFFDPILNLSSMNRSAPLETIKRVEVVTGPGGVLWGANSFLGVVNVITKDAEDVNGLEVNARYGAGPGDPNDFRAYALFGQTFFKDRLKVMLHASYETFQGAQYTVPAFLATSPAPQPPGPVVYGTDVTCAGDPSCVHLGTRQSANDTSWLAIFDGKISAGPLSLYWSYPIGNIYQPLNFSGGAVTQDKNAMGQVIPASTANLWNFYDRYAILEYRDRFVADKVGLDAKLYYIDFERHLAPRVFGSSVALPGGLSFDVTGQSVTRFGATLDADATISSWLRGIAGAEVFKESVAHATAVFTEPDVARLPLVCPLAPGGGYVPNCPLTFINAADRTVVGVFADAQLKPVRTLTLDGGVRYQQGFGGRPYDAQYLGSAALVWQFAPNFHLKLNFSQGFRPPVFNNTDSNGAAVEFNGNPNLKVEQSTAYQGEVNARLLKNVKNIRELQLRLDYSYTVLDNYIVVERSAYQNSGSRGIQSVEFLSKLYLNGDHSLNFTYTFLQVKTSDSGELRSVPNHWFTLGATFNLIKDTLDVNTNLNIFGAYEDPNRFISGLFGVPGQAAGQGAVAARFSDVAFDRLSPVALLQLGVRLRLWKDHVSASVQVFNVLNQKFYYPDVFYDQAPTIEIQPLPAPGISGFASLTFRP